MKRTRKLLSLLAAAIMLFTLMPSLGAADADDASRPLTASERAAKIEKLAEFSESVAAITAAYDKDIEAKKGDGEFALARIIVKSAEKLHDDNAVAEASGYNDWQVFQYSSPAEARAALARFNRMRCVEWAEADGIMTVNATPGSSSFNSWGYGATHANTYAYNEWLYAMYGSVESMPTVIVAVVDTGADMTHPYLSGRLVRGWNVVDNNSNPTDGHSHGTHVSGTIVDGTFANVKVMPIKVLSDSGSGSTLDVGIGMEYAYLHGAQVENMSLGGVCDGNSEHHFMAEIVDSAFNNGTTVVVAAGNESQDAVNCCPANIARLCTVAAIGSNHSLCYFSNYGPCVDIAAPGDNIYSCVPGGGYENKSGTSMASPHVAAMAAQVKTANPDMSADDVVSALKGAAASISASGAGAGMLHLAPDMYPLDAAANAEGRYSHFVSSGSYAWTADGDCVVSGNAGVNSSTSVMKTELYVGLGQSVTFDYKVSSEPGKDFFRVKANGSVIFEDCGERDWTTATVAIPGTSSIQLTFEFSKNASGSEGADKAWVRNVRLDPSISSAANLTGGTVLFESVGAYPWTVCEAENAAMSGNSGVNGSQSVMTAHASISKGMLLTFKYKVEADNGDSFIFRFDGRNVLTSGATEGYVDFEYIVPYSGDHALEFVFNKDASGAAGEDAAFVRAFNYYHTFESAVNADGYDLPFDNTMEDYAWAAMHDYACSTNWGEASSSGYFTLTLNMQAGETLTFRYRTSSVDSYDYFNFYVDGQRQIHVSGERSWANYTFTATQNKSYTFKWSYDKGSWDLSSWYGVDDAAYVDDVAYSGYQPSVLGDVDGDGSVNSNDALMVLRYALGLIPTLPDMAAADVNGDGQIDANDALLIVRMALGLIDSF